MDPLALLREFWLGNKFDSVVKNGSRVDFGDLYSFESDTLTRFKSRGGYYTLGTIYFFLKNKDVAYGKYFQNAREENFGTVAVVDKKALLNYMEGNDEGCAQIDVHMPNMPSMSTKRPIEEQEELQRKLQKVEQAQGIGRTSSDNPEEWTIDQIYSQEKRRFDPSQAMRVPVDFGYVIQFAKNLLNETESRQRVDQSIDQRQGVRPIILVPSGMTSMVNMFNVKDFLEDGNYVAPAEVYSKNPTKTARMTIARSFQRDYPIKYIISEKGPKKTDTELWKRVVAVVLNGKPSQFKDFPFKGCSDGNVYDMLHNHVRGFYFQFHDDKFNESPAASWKVKVMTIHKHNRHGDKLLMQQFWREIDRFVEEKKLNKFLNY